jgi:hypothetical protein
VKKKDVIVIVGLLLLIGVGYMIYLFTQGGKETVEVYYQNQLIDTIDIHIDHTYTYQGSYGSFSLEVKDEKYHATNVECPNHNCEKVGWVSQGSAKQIVCAPNEIYVIQSDSQDNVQ